MNFLIILCLTVAVVAQVPAYGQCGGANYSGDTTCVSGYYCKFNNEWYSQCVPGSDPGASTSLVTSTTTTKPTSTSSSLPSASSTFTKADGLKFNIDGVTKYYAGTNSYWISFLTNNADVDLVLNHLQSSGLKILRIWGFNDVNTTPGSGTVYFQSFAGSTPTINTGEYGLQRLDYIVKSAEQRGIKLIINFVNNWDDYGGMNAYVKFYGGSKTQWYTTTKIQDQYKAYIKAVVSRYVNSKAIFAWELANEPRCQGCDTSVIYNWASSISQYIKGLDPNHMVTLGDEGFGLAGDGSYPYGYSEGVDFVKNLGIKSLDFGTFHLYPSSWGTSNDWGNAWIQAHGKACATAGKPCLFEEYGVTDASQHCPVESQWQTTARSSTGLAGDLFWQLGDTLSTGQTHNDGNTIYYGSSDWTCLVTNSISAIAR